MKFRYELRADHLRMVAEGGFDVAAVRDAIGEVARLAREHGLQRILVDARDLPRTVTIAERHELAAYLAALKSGLRIAVLVTPEQNFTKVFEDTAVNRGTAVRTTASEAEALAFLGVEK